MSVTSRGRAPVFCSGIAVAAAITLVPVGANHTVSGEQARTRDVTAAVDAVADRTLREERLSSLSVVVATGSRVLLSKAYGLADLENDVRAGEQTFIGSARSRSSSLRQRFSVSPSSAGFRPEHRGL
jgi:CubicO group peptidase (beta-lactamase class C family)